MKNYEYKFVEVPTSENGKEANDLYTFLKETLP